MAPEGPTTGSASTCAWSVVPGVTVSWVRGFSQSCNASSKGHPSSIPQAEHRGQHLGLTVSLSVPHLKLPVNLMGLRWGRRQPFKPGFVTCSPVVGQPQAQKAGLWFFMIPDALSLTLYQASDMY